MGVISCYLDNIISIHALLAESDKLMPLIRFSLGTFLSTLSLRRATRAPPYNLMIHQNFYPRSPCGERHLGAGKSCNVCRISIHALLAESDTVMHALKLADTMLFLSTLSLRRATNARPETRRHDAISIHALLAESDHRFRSRLIPRDNFYPRSPCGERLSFSPC